MPYVGRMHAAGHTPAQIEQDIGARLDHEAPGAQVTVLVVEDLTNNVIVQGDVAKPGRYPVVPNSSGLLDILAMAGGPHTPDRQTQVRITRGDVAVTRTLSHLVNTRAMEMDLAPGDRILVQPRLTTSFTPSARSTAPENRPTMPMTSAWSTRWRGSPAWPTIMPTRRRCSSIAASQPNSPCGSRQARPPLADRTGQPPPGQPPLGQPAANHDTTSVIYQLNLRDPNGFFVAQQFPVLPDDLIYVSEAPIAEASKVFQLLTGVSGLGAIPRNLGGRLLTDTPEQVGTEKPEYQALAAEAVATTERQPGNVAILLHAAAMLLRAGDIARSIRFARDAVTVDPASVPALRTLSGILNVAGERAEAIRTANNAIALAPANAELRLHLGSMLAADRRWREAAEHLSLHVVSPAATPVGWRLLSAVLHQAGNAVRAIDAARGP